MSSSTPTTLNFSHFVNAACNESSPACLVTEGDIIYTDHHHRPLASTAPTSPCTTSFARVSIEVLIEQDQVLPVRVIGISRVGSVAWPVASCIWDKQGVHSVEGREGGMKEETLLVDSWNALRVPISPHSTLIPYTLHHVEWGVFHN